MRLPYVLSRREVRATASATLRGGWLLAARSIWVLVAILAMGLFLAATPAEMARQRNPDAATRAALAQHGISAGIYALCQVGADVIVAVAFCAVGALIFWRKSDERLRKAADYSRTHDWKDASVSMLESNGSPSSSQSHRSDAGRSGVSQSANSESAAMLGKSGVGAVCPPLVL
jgi:hypothetical protein